MDIETAWTQFAAAATAAGKTPKEAADHATALVRLSFGAATRERQVDMFECPSCRHEIERPPHCGHLERPTCYGNSIDRVIIVQGDEHAPAEMHFCERKRVEISFFETLLHCKE